MTITTASSQTRFSKLSDGSWGVSCIPGELHTGDRVRVQKANGEYREVTVGAVEHVDRGAWNMNAPNGREYRTTGSYHSRNVAAIGTGGSDATDKQLAYIRKLGGTPTDGLSKKDASTMIDQLKVGTPERGGREAAFRRMSREDAEIRGGEAATRLAQQVGPAGSEAREAAYLAQEMQDYNLGL